MQVLAFSILQFAFCNFHSLVSEVPHAREYHRHAVLVGSGNDFVIFDRTTGLDDRSRASLGGLIEPVAEGIKGVRCYGRASEIQPVRGGAHDRNLGGINAAHLAGANTEHLVGRGEDDGVRFDVAANAPGKVEGFLLGFRRPSLGRDCAGAHVNSSVIPILQQHSAPYAAHVIAAFLRLAHIQLQEPYVEQAFG